MRLKTILKSFSAPTLALSIETLMQHSRWHLVPPVSVWSVGPFVSQTVTEISKSKHTKNLHPPTTPFVSRECEDSLHLSSRDEFKSNTPLSVTLRS